MRWPCCSLIWFEEMIEIWRNDFTHEDDTSSSADIRMVRASILFATVWSWLLLQFEMRILVDCCGIRTKMRFRDGELGEFDSEMMTTMATPRCPVKWKKSAAWYSPLAGLSSNVLQHSPLLNCQRKAEAVDSSLSWDRAFLAVDLLFFKQFSE